MIQYILFFDQFIKIGFTKRLPNRLSKLGFGNRKKSFKF